MLMLLRLRVAVLLAVLAAAAPCALATTVESMTFSEVVDGAEVIAVGAVTAVVNTWDPERGTPFTEVTFSGLEVLKGEVAGTELTLRFLGGSLPGGSTLVVAGMPQFAAGDRAVLFSTGNGIEACPLVGWWQGLYRLFYDAGQDAFTVADHSGRAVVGIDGGLGRMEASLSTAANDEETIAGALTLDEFRSVVRSAVR